MAIVFGVKTVRFESGSNYRVWPDKELNAAPDWLVFKDTLIQRALVVAPFPGHLVPAESGVGGPVHSAAHDAVFGASRGYTHAVPLVTGLEIDGLVAVVRRAEWTEGGGDGWIGPPSQKRAYTAGLWLPRAALQAWAEELVKTPLYRKLVQAVYGLGREDNPRGGSPKYIEESDLGGFEVLKWRHFLQDRKDGTITQVVSVRLWGEETRLQVRRQGWWWAEAHGISLGGQWAFRVLYTREGEERLVWDDAPGTHEHQQWAVPAPVGRPFVMEDGKGPVLVRFTPEVPDAAFDERYEANKEHEAKAAAFSIREGVLGVQEIGVLRSARGECRTFSRLGLTPEWAAKAVEAGGTIVT